MDELKKKAASLGLAATMATSALSSNINAGEDNTSSNISYVQSISDDNIISNDNDVDSNSISASDFSGSAITTYDLSGNDIGDSFVNVGIKDDSLSKRNVSFDSDNSISENSFVSPIDDASVVSNVDNNFDLGTNNNIIPNVDNTVSSINNSNANNVDDVFVQFENSNKSENNSFNRNESNNSNSVDYECYSLMQDAISYSLRRFNSNYSSLSDALESIYKVKLSDKQRLRYDTVMRDTYEAYNMAISAYESGDIDTFRKISDEVLNSKKYLNLDDFVDILAININKQGNYIKDSSNYSITDGKLVIDGITLDSLFSDSTYVNLFDVMSLIQFYSKKDNSDSRVLDIMQVPNFIVRQVTNPTNFTIIDYDKTVFAYDNSVLKQKFDNIYGSYSSKLGLDRFSQERLSDGSSVLYAYDKENNRIRISDKDNASGLFYFLTNLSEYRKSQNCKVGYFSGRSMKQFLSVFENGIENVKVPETYSVRYNSEYESYSLMQDTVGFAFNVYNRSYPSISLTDSIESNYGVKLSDLQKARYDTLINDTYVAYQSGIAAYEDGRVSDFRKICSDILVDKKYMNLDDLVDIMSININLQGDIIKNSDNYSFSDGMVIIDGINVEKLFEDDTMTEAFNVLKLYSDSNMNDTSVLAIMRVPVAIIKEAIKPSSYSLIVDGSVYAYTSDKLKEKYDRSNDYFTEKIGLTDFGIEHVTNSQALYYGFDKNSNKQYIDNNSEYLRDLSKFICIMKEAYNRSKDGKVGYFDAEMIKGYLRDFDENCMSKTK